MAKFTGLQTGKTHSFAVVKLEDVELTLLDEKGKPLAGWWVLLTAPDGAEQKKQADSSGKVKFEKVLHGECQVKVSQDEPNLPPQPPPPPPPPAPPTPPDAGSGEAAEERDKPLKDTVDTLPPIQGGGEAPVEGHDDPEAPVTEPGLHPMRKKIVETALSQVGLVHDQGGEGPRRKGWERLKEFFEVSCDWDDAFKFGKTYQDGIQLAGKRIPAGKTPDGKQNWIHWCGIFALWAVKKAGVPGLKWRFGQPIQGLKPCYDKKGVCPGDIGVVPNYMHHFVVVERDGDNLVTVDGNVEYQSVARKTTRKVGDLAYYYKTWPETYV